jgi:Avirulence protein
MREMDLDKASAAPAHDEPPDDTSGLANVAYGAAAGLGDLASRVFMPGAGADRYQQASAQLHQTLEQGFERWVQSLGVDTDTATYRKAKAKAETQVAVAVVGGDAVEGKASPAGAAVQGKSSPAGDAKAIAGSADDVIAYSSAKVDGDWVAKPVESRHQTRPDANAAQPAPRSDIVAFEPPSQLPDVLGHYERLRDHLAANDVKAAQAQLAELEAGVKTLTQQHSGDAQKAVACLTVARQALRDQQALANSDAGRTIRMAMEPSSPDGEPQPTMPALIQMLPWQEGVVRVPGFGTAQTNDIVARYVGSGSAELAQRLRDDDGGNASDLWEFAQEVSMELYGRGLGYDDARQLQVLGLRRPGEAPRLTPFENQYQGLGAGVRSTFPNSAPGLDGQPVHSGQISGQLPNGQRVPLTRSSYPASDDPQQQASLLYEQRKLRSPEGRQAQGVSEQEALDRMASSGAILVHTDPAQIPKIFEEVDRLLGQVQSINATTPSGRERCLDLVAQMHWWLAHAMPSERGSAVQADIFVRGVMKAHGIAPPPWASGVSPDITAMTSTMEDFVVNYAQLFERQPLR